MAGLPEPMHNHALVMARFAKDCLRRMHEAVRELEVILGPDTADLDMRIGMHRYAPNSLALNISSSTLFSNVHYFSDEVAKLRQVCFVEKEVVSSSLATQ